MKRNLHQQFIEARTTMTYTEWLEKRLVSLEAGLTPEESREERFLRLAREIAEHPMVANAMVRFDDATVVVYWNQNAPEDGPRTIN